MKICSKCNVDKPLSEFYHCPSHNGTATAACKECTRSAVSANRAKRIDKYRAYDAKRYKNDPRVAARHRKYEKTKAGKASMWKSRKKWLSKNQIKRGAHVIVGNAVRDGRLGKPTECSLCGVQDVRIEGHHEDYSKPLEVIWCCRKCHVGIHRAAA